MPDEVEAVDDLAELCELAAGDLDPGKLGPAAKPLADLAQDAGVGRRHGDVVEHRERLRADADHVVDVHRHAVDAHRVPAPHALGEDELGADAVGGHREPAAVVEPHDAGVVAGPDRLERLAPGVDLAQRLEQRVHRRVRRGLADPGAGVGVVAHEERILAARRAATTAASAVR